jgi:hypothetical protein
MKRKHNYPAWRASSKPMRELGRKADAMVREVHRQNLAAAFLDAQRSIEEATTNLKAARQRLEDLRKTLRILGLDPP